MSNFYSYEELKEMGIKEIGKNVRISKKASLYSPEKMSFKDNVRIDDFCILSGDIKIGSYVHISAYSALYGSYGIEIGDFCGCSPRSMLLSGSDDFSGEHMISPMVPEKYTDVCGKKIKLNNYCQVGANSIVMPGVEFKEGAVSGCFSLIKVDLESWTINAGIPAKRIKERKKNILKLVEEFKNEI